MSFLGGELRQAIDTRRVLDDPVLFSKEILGVELWSKQREILSALWDGNDVDVQSCHSAGKTKVAAVATLGWVARPGGCVVTTAPSWDPVRVRRQINLDQCACVPRETSPNGVRSSRSACVFTFLLNVARAVRRAVPRGNRHCSSRRARSSRPLTTGHHAMTPGDQMILSSQRLHSHRRRPGAA